MNDERREAEFRRATSLRDCGDLTAARDVLEDLSRRYPSELAIWLVLGDIQMSQQDFDSAEISFEVATVLRPRHELASLALFHTLRHLNRTNDAFAEMRRFLLLRPESHEYDLLRQELENDQSGGSPEQPSHH